MIILPEGYLALLDPGEMIAALDDPVGEVAYWHVLPGKYAGTPVERRIRQAFLANRSGFAKLFQIVLGTR